MKRPARLSSSPSRWRIRALMASFHASAATRPSDAAASVIIVWMMVRVLFICLSVEGPAGRMSAEEEPQAFYAKRPREVNKKSLLATVPVLRQHVAEERAL